MKARLAIAEELLGFRTLFLIDAVPAAEAHNE